MHKFVVIFLFNLLFCNAFSQKLGPEDTLIHTDRTFGSVNSLLHVMDGFSSCFFLQPQKDALDPIAIYQPGLGGISNANIAQKNLLFSALPHLGFGYGFGAQGSQILRLDYEQSLAHHTLINLRYDRWQRNGFIRSDDLRASGLQIKLHQKGRAHEFQVTFENASDDRQWSGGIANYTQLNTLALDLIPVLKEQSYTQKNSYNGTIELRYRVLGDSTQRLNLASFHAYDLQQRLYHEIGNLSAYYPQTFFNTDTCIDTFRQVYLENRLGLNWSAPKINISSLVGVKQRQWSDTQYQYDTLEFNWYNQLVYLDKVHTLKHENALNIIGAGQGMRFNTSYGYHNKETPFAFSLKHRYSNEWPVLMQRTYFSNLTNYIWSNPQKEKFQHLEASLSYSLKSLALEFGLGLADYKSVYRFDLSNMNWSTSGLASNGQFATIRTKVKYQLGPIQLNSTYQFLMQNTAQFLPKHKASLAFAWSRGIFKEQRLKMVFEAQVNYQSRFQALVFIPFVESLDWANTQSNMHQNGFLNAQVSVALEVKTFRFFINAANLGSFWNQPEISVVQGYPFAPMQIRIGLTWDFWN